MNIKIIVATHKAYDMPSDDCYLPVHVGAAISSPLPYISDAEGESISEKNRSYCELTALYWAWKNLDADVIGLCHYRRLFRGRDQTATSAEIEKWMEATDAVLPRHRNYYIETNYSQYEHAHHKEDLDKTYEIIGELCPEYLPSWPVVMNSTKGHRFNMFIMKRELMCAYCEWLFPILFELEKRLDTSSYSEYDSRVFGFVAERLMDIWIDHNSIRYLEKPVFETEKVNWIKKGTQFVWRKIKAHG